MSEWKEILLGDLADIKGGKRLPKGEVLVETLTNHPYIRTRDINNYKIDESCLLYVPDNVYTKISKYIVDMDDIIISIVGTIGLCAKIPEILNQASLTENCAKITNLKSHLIDKDFLYFYLISNLGQEEIKIRSVGSTQPKLPLYNIKEIPIPLPLLPEQKAIAGVLSSLDDKINLLHRQNKTLEAMAETLFRQWFIEEAADDWEEGKLGDFVNLVYGKSLTSATRTGKGYPVVGSNGIIDYHSEYLVKGPGIVIGRKGTLGKVIFLEDNFYPIDTTYYIHSLLQNSNLLFEYFLLKSIDFSQMNSDSAVPGLNKNIALSTEIIKPPIANIYAFNNIVSSFFLKIQSNLDELKIITQMRNMLLPKLMSGEVRVNM